MIQIYSTLAGKKEPFKARSKDKAIGMYVCGPTVYDFGHLGHGRSAVSFDVIRRYLLYSGYKVTFVSNYTDIDDKMIQRAEIMKITVPELSNRIIPEYEKDYGALGVLPPDIQPRATDYIAEMIDMIQSLIDKGFAYTLDDGVYFDVGSFKQYGKLSKQNLEQLKAGIRVRLNEEKRTPHDFVLWKFSKPGEPKWDSPWGEGRPGWHIECSAMSMKHLGETIDIHGGGADLVFPHHECEIAQSEAVTGKEFSRFWVHNGFIRVDNEKMSKSLGNFFTLRDIFKKYRPQVVRFLFLQTHYRSPIDFSHEILDHAENGLMRIHDFIRRLRGYDVDSKGIPEALEAEETLQASFEKSMNDDFDTPGALAACFDFIKLVNRLMDEESLSLSQRDSMLQVLNKIDSVLGLFEATGVEQLDDADIQLIALRERARADRDWGKADELRAELLKRGIVVEDTAKGTVWKRV